MILKDKVKGLSSGNRFTFENKNGSWWADSIIPRDRFQALFRWASSDKSFWEQNIYATIACDKLSTDGTPINGKVIEIEIKI